MMTEEQRRDFEEFKRQYLEWAAESPFRWYRQRQEAAQRAFIIQQEKERREYFEKHCQLSLDFSEE